MWNPRGFHVINQLLSETKMDSNYFTTTILSPLRKEFNPRDRALHPKPLVVHMDNYSIHTSGATQRFMCSPGIRENCVVVVFGLYPVIFPVLPFALRFPSVIIFF
jgi:hypothetical protein